MQQSDHRRRMALKPNVKERKRELTILLFRWLPDRACEWKRVRAIKRKPE
jgi:hypothetical protein